MNRFPILVALFAGCAHAPVLSEPVSYHCETVCGLRADEGSCPELQAVETRVLLSFARSVAGWDYLTTCRALKGWRVLAHDALSDPPLCLCRPGAWWEGGQCVLGYTHWRTKELEVPSSRWSMDGQVLGHEMVHALQVSLGEWIGHCHWRERGISKALVQSGVGIAHAVTEPEACAPLWTIPPTR